VANPFKLLLSQTAIYGLSSILGRLFYYMLVPLHTRLFLPEEYGVITELYAYVSFLLILLTYGMETGFFRYAGKTDNWQRVYSTILFPLFATSLLFVIITIIFSENIANFIKYPEHSNYIIWFAVIIGIDAFTALPYAKLRYLNKAVRFAFIRLTNIASNVLLNLFFLVFCPYWLNKHPDSSISIIYSPDVGVGYVFIANLISSVLMLIMLFGDIFKIKFYFNYKSYIEILRYSFPLLFAGLAGMINQTLDRILLKVLLVAPENAANASDYVMSQVGIYGACYKLSILIVLFIQAFRYAAEPFFFSHEKSKNSNKIYADVMKYFIIFNLVVFLGIMLYIDVFKHFIGIRFHDGLVILPFLLIGQIFYGIIFNLSFWYKLTNRTQFGAYISFLGAAITIGLNFILIPRIGYLGAAITMLVCFTAMMLISFFLGRIYYPVAYNLKRIVAYFGLALSIYAVSVLISDFNTFFKLSVNSILLIAYIAIVVRIEFFSKLKSILFKKR